MELIQLTNEELEELIGAVVSETIKQLGIDKLTLRTQPVEKTAYQKTEALLYNYNNFKKVILEKERRIAEIRKYGLPKTSGSIMEFKGGGGTVQGIVLPDEEIESAVHTIRASVDSIVQVVALIDNTIAELRDDPYKDIIKMLYMDSMTQEDVSVVYGCSQMNISKHKTRLVREMALRLFPSQVLEEMMKQ